jgi:hypothetical protein
MSNCTGSNLYSSVIIPYYMPDGTILGQPFVFLPFQSNLCSRCHLNPCICRDKFPSYGSYHTCLQSMCICKKKCGYASSSQVFYCLNQTNLIASFGTTTQFNIDTNLLNPWGIVINDSSILYSANSNSQTVTSYNLVTENVYENPINVVSNGVSQNPTGLIYNNNSSFFLYPTGTNSLTAPATLVICTLQGSILGYSLVISSNPPKTFTMYQNTNKDAMYTDMDLITNSENISYLVVTNFGMGIVELFSPITEASGILENYIIDDTLLLFVDPFPVSGYAPFNVISLGSFVFILYAKNTSFNKAGFNGQIISPSILDTGTGKGYINIFNSNGLLIINSQEEVLLMHHGV